MDNSTPSLPEADCLNVEEKIRLNQVAAESVANGDGKSPLEILPLEVWCLIFDNLTSPKDMASCSNASPVFRKELKPKSAQFLFEQVFPVLIKNGVFAPGQLFDCLLPLRQVCRSWKSEVDSFLENHPCHSHLNQDNCARATNISNSPATLVDCFELSPSYQFSSTAKLRQCTNFLRGLPPRIAGSGSFFLGRSIDFHCDIETGSLEGVENWFHFRTQAEQLLDIIGEELWYCQFRKVDWHASILLKMPNLKVLKLWYESVDIFYSGLVLLPELRGLQVFKLKMERYSPRVVLQLLDKYKHIKKLEVDIPDSCKANFTYIEEDIADLANKKLERIRFPNLEELCIKVYSDEEMLRLGRIILNNMPTLQSLSLVLPNCDKFQDFGLIFSILQNKTEGPITSLKLILKSLPAALIQVTNPLQLSKLEELTIDTGENVVFGNIDFILPLKSFKKITLIQRKPKEEEEVQLGEDSVNFLGFEKRMYESNVWNLLPGLDQVLLKIVEEDGVWKTFYYERAAYDKLFAES